MPLDIKFTSKMSGDSFVGTVDNASNVDEQVRCALRARRPEVELAWACEGTCWNDDSTKFTLSSSDSKVQGAGSNSSGDFTIRGTEMPDGLGFKLVFINQHGEWPVSVKWEPVGIALCGMCRMNNTNTRASFKVEKAFVAHGQAVDVLLYDAHGQLLLDLDYAGLMKIHQRQAVDVVSSDGHGQVLHGIEGSCAQVFTEMQYLWTGLDSARKQREQIRMDKVLKEVVQWTKSRSLTTFGTELATQTAGLLMAGKPMSGRWFIEFQKRGFTTKMENPWSLSFSRCFCLTWGKGMQSSKTWLSVEEFVAFFAEKTDNEMTAFFVSTEIKCTDEICRVQGTLRRKDLLQLAGAGHSGWHREC